MIVLPEELSGEGLAVIQGRRAALLYELHELRTGLEVRAALLGGQRGSATVLEAAPQKVCLKLRLSQPPCEPVPLALLIAVPRPQTVKKVLQTAAMLGVSSIHFVPSDNSVKSYLQSKTLASEAIQQEIVKGLEQCCDSRPPAVVVWQALWRFMKEGLPSLSPPQKPQALCLLPLTSISKTQNLSALGPIPLSRTVICAIGPESGWSEREEHDWIKTGFQPISLGERMLRVETAVAVLLGQIALLRAGTE